MGLFRSHYVDVDEASAQFESFLLEGETILSAFRRIRDTILLTNLRIVHVNIQGLIGTKQEYFSIPWRSVTRFSIETAGTFDLDADLKIWFTGATKPIEAKISRKNDPRAVQRIMSEHVLAKP